MTKKMPEKEKNLCKLQSEVLKAIAHPIRLAIIKYLAQEEKCVCEIVEYVGTSQSNISKHLGLMKRTGILSDRKDGLSVYYKLNMPCALGFFDCIHDIIETQVSERSALMK